MSSKQFLKIVQSSSDEDDNRGEKKKKKKKKIAGSIKAPSIAKTELRKAKKNQRSGPLSEKPSRFKK